MADTSFIVYDDGTPATYMEARLTRAIINGELDGDELFRRSDEPETALRPLHRSLLFQRLHGVDAQGAERVVHTNKVRAFSRHLTAFMAVVLGLNILGVNTWWAVFWFIALAVHGARVAGPFAALYRERQDDGPAAVLGVLYGLGERSQPEGQKPAQPAATEIAAAEARPVPTTVARGPNEPTLHDELREELSRLAPLRDELDDAGREALDSTAQALDELFAQRRQIAEQLAGEDVNALEHEVADLKEELDYDTLDARTREAIAQTLEAARQRLDSMHDARRVDRLLRVRARAVLHKLKALRLSVVSSARPSEASDAARLGEVVDALRHDVSGAAELEEALAEARTGPRARARRRN